MISSNSSWKISNLPFIYTPLLEPHNPENIPDSMPFSLGFDGLTGRILQQQNSEVSGALEQAYKAGSMISGQMAEGGNGRKYADDFLEFIKENCGGNLEGKNVLEVGCGTGYLLYRLKKAGANVIGIDPGEHSRDGFEDEDLTIVRDFFPSAEVTGKFDIIIVYGVLEHVENPGGFLNKLAEYLDNNGFIFAAVPDCEACVEVGDISILLHEHWSYFTSSTLENTIAQTRCFDFGVRKAGYGGLLYAHIQKNDGQDNGDWYGYDGDSTEGADKVLNTERNSSHGKIFENFVEKAKSGGEKFKFFLTNAHENDVSVGIYAPGRAINNLIISGATFSHCRFFDDNPLLHGTYFPSIMIPIESRHELVSRPVDKILIMSHSFADAIKAQLIPLLPENTEIVSIQEVLDG